MTTPRPNLSVDPRDHDPPHHDPPSKPDFVAVQLAYCRRLLGRPQPPHLPDDPDDDEWMYEL
ncbi:MAG TPA: hypothetical protein VGH66_07975 [Acidimicrobiales bacterium]|jgi:hypothetical protein